ncbi:hypothetical protein SH1V18_46380 [Vallitalea longa]|uniref:Radical SAM core domain-containing protein n=1 Tax=Vallitalea longa TaxID=2936439 RepID=A0A9W5YIW8_9FIRM|nr:radical SAM protein [Vallitalea longa]GKX32158.1 hypothetical protein SH1V18_46380 [Vallitalea longa]
MQELVLTYMNCYNGYVSGAEYQLDCGYIGSYLLKNHVKVLQYIHKNPNRYMEMVKELNEFDCEKYLFYINEYNYYVSKVIINRLREVKPYCLIMIAGPSAEYIGKNHMSQIQVDVCITDEAPYIILQILKGLPYKDIPNLIYRETSNLIMTCKKDYGNQLDSLSFPYSSGFIPVSEIQNVGMLTSSGCYGNCLFCSYKLKGKIFKLHTIDGIIDELKFISKFVKGKDININFLDDCFSVNPERTYELCERLIENKLIFRYWCCTRADLLNEELVSLMAKCNFKEMVIGLETASPRILKALGKLQDTQDPNNYIKHLQHMYNVAMAKGINPYLSINFGLPYEDRIEANQSIEYIKQHNLEKNSSICYMTAFPESKIFDASEKYNVIKEPSPVIMPYRTYYKQYMEEVYYKLTKLGIDTNRVKKVKRNVIDVLAGTFNGKQQEKGISNVFVTHNDISKECIHKWLNINGTVYIETEKLHMKKDYYTDNRKNLKRTVREYDENLERAYEDNIFLPNQIFYFKKNNRIYLQYNDNYTKIPISIPIRELTDKEDYKQLANEAEQYHKTRRIKIKNIGLGIIENACRFTHECSVNQLKRVEISDDNLYCCGNTVPIGTTMLSYHQVLNNIHQLLKSTNQNNKCNTNIPSNSQKFCSCLFVPTCFDKKEFRDYMIEFYYIGEYVKFINEFQKKYNIDEYNEEDILLVKENKQFIVIN